MTLTDRDAASLVPLAYHTAMVDYLKAYEPDVWQWASARDVQDEHLEGLRTALLRDTYRLDPEGHAASYAPLTSAMARLGIDLPATLYQSSAPDMNAALIFVPGEIHIVLQGQLLERLSDDELLAVFGHELAHHVLWSRDGGQFLVADRILGQAGAQSGAASHLETCRRYALHTELFADRGSAIAAGGIAPAISTLVKVQTGIHKVDAAAYLRQALEIETKDNKASDGHSHPETFIRARAVEQWWNGAPELDTWIAQRLHGPLALERLDLPGQRMLQQLTRGFLCHFSAGELQASELVQAQIRMLFADWQPGEAATGLEAFGPDQVADCVRDYLLALMLDLALADPDVQDAALVRAGKVALALGNLDRLQANLRRDAAFGKREMDRYKRQLAKEDAA